MFCLLEFVPLGVLSTWDIVHWVIFHSGFYALMVSSTRGFVQSKFCLLGILSTEDFVFSGLYPLVVLSTVNFIHCGFYLLGNLSTEDFVYWGFCPLGVLTTGVLSIQGVLSAGGCIH